MISVPFLYQQTYYKELHRSFLLMLAFKYTEQCCNGMNSIVMLRFRRIHSRFSSNKCLSALDWVEHMDTTRLTTIHYVLDETPKVVHRS